MIMFTKDKMTTKPNPKFPSGAGEETEINKFNLSTNYIYKPVSLLPDPPGIPFGKQGFPIPDFQQKHASYKEVNQMEDPFLDYNDLPFFGFTGTTVKQINQGAPTFRLGVNENRKE